jgi:hypothetical protein
LRYFIGTLLDGNLGLYSGIETLNGIGLSGLDVAFDIEVADSHPEN